jgi:hypothetical protein
MDKETLRLDAYSLALLRLISAALTATSFMRVPQHATLQHG